MIPNLVIFGSISNSIFPYSASILCFRESAIILLNSRAQKNANWVNKITKGAALKLYFKITLIEDKEYRNPKYNWHMQEW